MRHSLLLLLVLLAAPAYGHDPVWQSYEAQDAARDEVRRLQEEQDMERAHEVYRNAIRRYRPGYLGDEMERERRDDE